MGGIERGVGLCSNVTRGRAGTVAGCVGRKARRTLTT